jgi:hypothetical protein
MGSEFKPILPAGIHCMTLEAFRLKFVDPFPQPGRKLIFDKFTLFLKCISGLGVVTELWLNGSFVTEKPEPGDIDVVAFVDGQKVNRLQSPEQRFLANITYIQLTYSTDIRFADKDDENIRSYWRGWYGFSRDERPKGFVCLNRGLQYEIT